MRAAGYEVVPVLIVRDRHATVQSQVKRGHVKTVEQAEKNIDKAMTLAVTELAAVGLSPTIVQYERFVENPAVRRETFAKWGLPEPRMNYFNADRKHKK
jgi:hypothetical protein